MATNPEFLMQLAGSGANAGNAYLEAFDRARQGALQSRQVDLQSQAFQARLDEQRQQQQQAAAYQNDLSAYMQNPTPKALGMLAMRYPDKAKALQDGYAALDAPARESRVTQLGQLYNAASSGRSDLAGSLIDSVIKAEEAQGVDTSDAVALKSQIAAGDKDALTSLKAFAQLHLAAMDPDFAKAAGIGSDDTNHFSTTGNGDIYDQRTGAITHAGTPKQEYRTVDVFDANGTKIGERVIKLGGEEGGGQASGDGAAGPAGDVSRLINSDAGGGYVPDSVQTLGQFVGFGKALNRRGAKSSSAGTYQINGSTMADFAPRALGSDWRNAPFNAETQDRVGEAIFNWAKQQPNPAAALRGRWVSLSPQAASQLVQGDWQGARGVIAQGETGGSPGASASRPARGGNVVYESVGASSGPKPKDAPSGYRYKPDGQTLEAIPGGPADKGRSGGGKALPDSVNKRLEPKIEARDGLMRALGTFKDDYAGHNVIGDLSNTIQGVTGIGAEGQRDWWAQFRSTDNVIRNALFGASLTDGEKAAYNATTITPRMAPAEIKRNLNSRLQIISGALARQHNVLLKSGFDQDALGALFNPEGGSAPPSAPSGFRILRVRPK